MIEAQSYEELGRKLRYLRLDRKLELDYTARQLHLRPRYLEALENGMLEELPGEPYVQGYFRQYARILGLEPEELVEAYQKIGALPQRRLFYIPDSIRREQHPSPAILWLTLLGAAVLTIWWVGEQTAPRATPVAVQEPAAPEEAGPDMPRTVAPDCLNTDDDFPAWPPCYQQPEPVFSAFLSHRPVRTIMELYR